MIDDDEPFRLEEATIDELHRAIKAGRTTCVRVSALELGRQPGQPLDTTRAASLGSSSGSSVSVSANLVMCSLGEETRASTRGPALDLVP
jgi:hypothetical protein